MDSTKIFSGLAVILTLFFMAGCGSLSPLAKPAVSSHATTQNAPLHLNKCKKADVATASFWKEIKNWQGVPYRYGGISAKGVDCSGLTVSLYENLYGIQLPRTTKKQIKTGVRVSHKSLRPGDLVFFKFRNNTGHVGIYIGDRRFTHASRKKKRVTISCLDNPFWKSRYRTARRILKKPPKEVAQTPLKIKLSDLTVY